MKNELINSSSNSNKITQIIENHPEMIPITLGVMGVIWLGSKAIEKGRSIKLRFGKRIELDVN